MTEANRPLKAAFWMLGSVLAFSAIAVAGRQVQARHDSFEVMTVRSLVGFTLLVILGAVTGQLRRVSATRLSGHFARNIVHFAGQNLWLVALGLIPLAQVFALEFTSPLWVILMGPLFLGERLTKARLGAAALGFLGILIVTRPGAGMMNWGTLAAAGAALSFATVAILTKRLTRGIPVYDILFWLTFMQFFFGLALALMDGHVTLPDAQTLPWLCLIGLAGVLAHLSLTSALALAPAGYVVPIDFLRLPLIALVGAAFYGEPLDPWVLLGGAVIFAGILWNIRAQLSQSDATSESKTN